MTTAAVPLAIDDPVNVAILAVSEDKLEGFQRDPLGEIARRSGVDVDVVSERIRALLQAGTIRRVRQTLLSTNLAHGALVAWQVPPEKLDPAFDFMFRDDPFTGHVVIRTTEAATAGSPQTPLIPARAYLQFDRLRGIVRRELGRVDRPALVVHAVQDHIAWPGSAELLQRRLAGPVECIRLLRSYHQVLVDVEGPEVVRAVTAFFRRHVRPPTSS